jgi:hypothetical protein
MKKSDRKLRIFPNSRRGQITIFIIISVILVAIVAGLFIFRESLFITKIPVSIEPVYTTFLACLEEDALIGIDILGSQAGYISLPEFESGSPYMPFSSQLDFLGNQIPYWYYVSGNNLQKEQVPSKKKMETQLEEFIESQIRRCVFDKYYEQGFEINQGEPLAEVTINDNNVEVNLNLNLDVTKAEDIALIKNHKILVKSKLGTLYDSARKIYEHEQENLFLENYAVDTLRLYAPVDGVELTCSPMVWSADEVFDNLGEAIEGNTLALKIEGGSYSLNKKENEYFIEDISIDSEVRFINSKNWPNTFEVAPSEENILMAKPVGNQQGLGILGFCYVPYHFIYSVKYPVLVQVYEGDEIFQFPMAVVVQGNKPRKALEVDAAIIDAPELCKYKNILIEVDVYDTDLNPVEADISYECFGTVCQIGKTSLEESLRDEFPQCVNGYLIAKAEGFEDAKYLYSTIQSGNIDVILNKLYEIEVDLDLDGEHYNDEAIINFISETSSKTVVYPEKNTVSLSEGQYEIQVYVYRNSSLKLDATNHEQCMEVPQSGLGGLFGLTKQKCFEIEIPAQIISSALAGGGKENYYILESELQGRNIITINARSLPLPESIADLQDNYMLFEEKDLDIYFK